MASEGAPALGLIERERELALVDDTLDDAMAGRGRLLVVEGAAGLGKTTLLQAAARAARERRMTMLSAGAADTERDHPFGVVRQLLEPRVLRLPETQTEAVFSGAAALARPVFEPAGLVAGTPQSLPATLHGLFWLVANLADERPLMVAVDDAQWADAPSVRFLLYLARRIEDLPLALIVGARPPEPGADAAMLAELMSQQTARHASLQVLSETAVARFVGQVLGAEPTEHFARACAAASGGNPFLLGELLRELVVQEVAPVSAEADRVARLRPAAISRAVLLRLVRLGSEAADVARAAAVLERATFAQVMALAGIGRDVGDRSVDALVQAGILSAEGTVGFVHPLLREAVYGEMAPRERARAHHAAARVLAEHDGSDDEIVAHLLATDAALDDRERATLERAGAAALAHGAPETAIACLERITVDRPAEVPAALRLRLGSAKLAAGRAAAAVEDLSAALAATADVAAAGIARVLAWAQVACNRADAAVQTLQNAVDQVGDRDPELSLHLQGELGGLLILTRQFAATERFERFEHLQGNTPGERMVLAVLAARRAMPPQRIDEAADIAERALGGGRLLEDQGAPEAAPFVYATAVLIAAERHQLAAQLLDAALEHVRERGSLLGFAMISSLRAMAAYARGDVRRAEAEARHGVTVARELAWRTAMPVAVAWLLVALVERGELDEAQQLLDEEQMRGPLRFGVASDTLLAVRAELRLAQHQPLEALTDLREVAECQDGDGRRHLQAPNNWRPPAVRAHMQLGDVEGARAIAVENLELARAAQRRRPLGIALHHVGLVEEDERLLEEAVATLDSGEMRLEQARALTELGALLRRRSRPADARRPLRLAADLAAACGASALEKRATAELAATGARRRRGPGGFDELTPSELRIAELAVTGLSNKQIAQSLFVTLKTVETHLGNAYRKLGIGSRGQLPEALAGGRRNSDEGV